ncbi:hypothetical protein Clacol_004511 [Clathrus columnatus]|uniref:Uncharacterized protein n=1 Tax=Clathrus columnatus TaxID=1419009 RepID=A0AAV5AEB9_9AGAM|nr:hypothetical protein Clacol_004511 [Clathrus columnatus]
MLWFLSGSRGGGSGINMERNDVYGIYNGLAKLGMEHVDFRWSNILSVIPNPEHGFVGRYVALDAHRPEKLSDVGMEIITEKDAKFCTTVSTSLYTLMA